MTSTISPMRTRTERRLRSTATEPQLAIVRVDPGEFRACSLRVHASLHDVPLGDV